MIAALPRRCSSRLVRELVLLRAHPYRSWSSSALVFAPHPDDETLGCGGTISGKTRHGANVHVAFMTDGSRSHEGRIAPKELGALRRIEAEAACRELGLSGENLTFLDIEDGSLAQEADRAGVRVRELLESHRPDEVFIPYHADGQPDHVATRAIVLDALSAQVHPVRVFEYPVWFWHHWPWVRLGGGLRTMLAVVAPKKALLYRELRWAADVRDSLALKRAALERHRSQMQRLGDRADWPVLSDVAKGDWLECFFTGYELFHSYAMPADSAATGRELGKTSRYPPADSPAAARKKLEIT